MFLPFTSFLEIWYLSQPQNIFTYLSTFINYFRWHTIFKRFILDITIILILMLLVLALLISSCVCWSYSMNRIRVQTMERGESLWYTFGYTFFSLHFLAWEWDEEKTKKVVKALMYVAHSPRVTYHHHQ